MNETEDFSSADRSLTELEQHLTQALRPLAPCDGFADRVLARTHHSGPASVKLLRLPIRSRLWASGAIAAALLAGIFVTEQTRQRRERRAADLAQQQFDTAMSITRQELNDARLQVQQAGIQIGQ